MKSLGRIIGALCLWGIASLLFSFIANMFFPWLASAFNLDSTIGTFLYLGITIPITLGVNDTICRNAAIIFLKSRTQILITFIVIIAFCIYDVVIAYTNIFRWALLLNSVTVFLLLYFSFPKKVVKDPEVIDLVDKRKLDRSILIITILSILLLIAIGIIAFLYFKPVNKSESKLTSNESAIDNSIDLYAAIPLDEALAQTNTARVHTNVVMHYVSSDAISTVGYDDVNDVLLIRFKSSQSLYAYFNVPKDTYLDMLEVDSVGSYFNTYIKGTYICSQIE